MEKISMSDELTEEEIDIFAGMNAGWDAIEKERQERFEMQSNWEYPIEFSFEEFK